MHTHKEVPTANTPLQDLATTQRRKNVRALRFGALGGIYACKHHGRCARQFAKKVCAVFTHVWCWQHPACTSTSSTDNYWWFYMQVGPAAVCQRLD